MPCHKRCIIHCELSGATLLLSRPGRSKNEDIYYLKFGFEYRYFHVINGKTGAIVYQNYSNGMMKTNLTQSDFKDLAKAINKQK